MSHCYEASVQLNAVQVDKLAAVIAAVEALEGWSKPTEFHWMEDQDGADLNSTPVVLRGMNDQDFANLVAHAAWTAHGAFCAVQVTMIDIEVAPCEEFEFGEENYQQMMVAE